MLLCEIELQCGFALKAYAGTVSALERLDPEAFWYSIQGLVTAAGHVQQLLDCDGALCAALEVPQESPLREKRLAPASDVPAAYCRWLASGVRGPLRQTNFGPLGVSRSDPGVFARYVDPDPSVFRLFGEEYELASLLAAIASLREKARSELRHIRELV
jgi:hypothetical protein